MQKGKLQIKKITWKNYYIKIRKETTLNVMKMIWWQRVRNETRWGKIMKTPLRQHILKTLVLVVCLLALRSIPCPSLLCCVLQGLHRADPLNHTYLASFTTVLLAESGPCEVLSRCQKTGRWTETGFIFSLLFSSSPAVAKSPQWFKFLLHSPGSCTQTHSFFPVFLGVIVVSCSC